MVAIFVLFLFPVQSQLQHHKLEELRHNGFTPPSERNRLCNGHYETSTCGRIITIGLVVVLMLTHDL